MPLRTTNSPLTKSLNPSHKVFDLFPISFSALGLFDLLLQWTLWLIFIAPAQDPSCHWYGHSHSSPSSLHTHRPKNPSPIEHLKKKHLKKKKAVSSHNSDTSAFADANDSIALSPSSSFVLTGFSLWVNTLISLYLSLPFIYWTLFG